MATAIAAAGRRLAHAEAAGLSERAAIEELARAQRAQPAAGPAELGDDIWESDAELAEFLADLRAVRAAALS